LHGTGDIFKIAQEHKQFGIVIDKPNVVLVIMFLYYIIDHIEIGMHIADLSFDNTQPNFKLV
jgi:hypothetical protein